MHLNSLDEIERWVLNWGTHATVVSPPELRNRLRNTAKALVVLYEKVKKT